jgi:hypothetical protein
VKFWNWRRRQFDSPHDLISAGKLVRGRISVEQYRSCSDDDRAVIVMSVNDMLNQMIRYCEPSYRKRLLLMSDHAHNLNSGELRDKFDQYLAANPDLTGIYAANAFEIFLSETTRIAVGGKLPRR